MNLARPPRPFDDSPAPPVPPYPLGEPVNRPSPAPADVKIEGRPGWWRRLDGSVYYREPAYGAPPAGPTTARRTP